MSLSKAQSLREHAYKSQCKRFEIFKSQDVQRGHFDVTFKIDGKILHAHKFILSSVSETLDSCLSSRWSKEGEVIKIDYCSYEIFYEFLCYVYSGECTLTDENVYVMVDIAEFYDNMSLKGFCEDFLGSRDITYQNIEELLEYAQKYSLHEINFKIFDFMLANKDYLLKSQVFLTCSKSFVFELYEYELNIESEEMFQAAYKWAEHQVTQKANILDSYSKFEAIKNELDEVLPFFRLSMMSFDFLKNFYLEKGFSLSTAEFLEFFSSDRELGENVAFKIVFELAEKQVLVKQQMIPNIHFNLIEATKTVLSGVISKVKFYEMTKEFLMEFVVAKGILSKEQTQNLYKSRVEIYNGGKPDDPSNNGDRIICGVFNDDYEIRRLCPNSGYMYINGPQNVCFPGPAFLVPSYPSGLKKVEGVVWYLCFDKDGLLNLKHHTLIDQNDYLIAEMETVAESQLDHQTVTFEFFNNL